MHYAWFAAGITRRFLRHTPSGLCALSMTSNRGVGWMDGWMAPWNLVMSDTPLTEAVYNHMSNNASLAT